MSSKRLMICFAVLLSLICASHAALARFDYEIGEQRETLTVQKDGVVMLDKEFTFHVLEYSTENGTEIWVGLPKSGVKVLNAVYVANGVETPVKYSVESDDDNYQVILKKFPAIKPGETGRFRFTARIPGLVHWLDKSQPSKSPTNQHVALSYVPAWWDKAVTRSLVLMMDFDSDLDPERLDFPQGHPIIGAHPDQKLRFMWEYSNLQPGEKRKHAVIIPRDYFAASFKPRVNWVPDWVVLLIFICMSAGMGLLVWFLYRTNKYRRYQSPVAYMKGNKAYTSFDPVEAAIFYNVPPDLLVKLITMGLIRKNAIKLENSQLRRVNSLEQLTWYENLFLDSVGEQVRIIPDKWKVNYEAMIKHFFDMVNGYCGNQTKAHYNNWLRNTTFAENTDPRWLVLQKQLAQGIFDKPREEVLRNAMPDYMNMYYPLFFMTMVHPPLAKINSSYYHTVFPGVTGPGNGGSTGSGCACACACACASSGGCT